MDSSYCLARMTAIEYVQSGKVEVDYISTHTNHELGIQECANLPLPKSLHKSVKEKYSQGISIERIMEGKSEFQCSIHACMSILYKLQIIGVI